MQGAVRPKRLPCQNIIWNEICVSLWRGKLLEGASRSGRLRAARGLQLKTLCAARVAYFHWDNLNLTGVQRNATL